MNNTSHPPLYRVGLIAFAFAASLNAQTANVTVNASSVVRDVPAGLGGVVCATPFWNTVTPDYRGDLVKARISAVRITGYPADSSGGVGTLAALDTKVAQLINMGATPVFIQCIESNSNTTFKNALLRLDGTVYPSGDSTPINQRVATNITYLVNRYKSAPFNLATQYWEIGNEPDLPNVNYAVATTQEYIDFFSLAHNQLVASGVRGNVLLAGPVTSYEYGFGNGNDGYKIRDDIMRDFLAACAGQVDIVTRHVYGLINPSWEGLTNTAYNQLNHNKEMAHFDHNIVTTRGEYGLLALMDASDVPAPSVGTGITEMNLFNDKVTIYNHTITQGLWFLLADHFTLNNPRSYLTNGFQLDRNNHDLAYYKNNLRSFPYWASYIHGVLTGDQVLATTSSNSHIVVTASKDASYLYVRVINRHNTSAYTATITTTGAPPVTAATRYRLTATETPDTGVATAFTPTFTDTFAPMTATVFRFPRTDAPTPPTPPAAPTQVVLSTDFSTAPTGMLIYANPKNLTSTPPTNTVDFKPLITTSGDLKLTTTTGYLATAVVFNATANKLSSPATRLQVRYGFKVNHVNADGFVFGAYSANPGTQGEYGQALGFYGQNNRLWGVKVDNNPDQLGIISGGNIDPGSEGWASQTIQPYATQEMYMVIDYEGAAGTVRARLYQGTNDSGTLRADVTNRVGVPASLPAGTVFGFTGGTSNYSQETLIHDLTVLADAGWANQDVGAVAAAGSTTHSGGTYTVKGSGQYIWNGADEFQFAYQQITGNCTITARLVSQTNTNANAQAGVMIRESLTTGSKHAMMLGTPSSTLQFIHRNSTNGGYSVPVTVTPLTEKWLRLVRVGNTFTASTSPNGTSSWTPLGSYTYSGTNTFSTGPVYVGLAVSSRVDGTLGTAVFDNVTITANP